MMPTKINKIIADMMAKVTSENKMTFLEFKKWLDMNSQIRIIVKESLRPSLWTVE